MMFYAFLQEILQQNNQDALQPRAVLPSAGCMVFSQVPLPCSHYRYSW